jgi:hypothetical protein
LKARPEEGNSHGISHEPSSFDRDALAARLKQLALGNIYIGGSSWKYEGWLDQIYTRSNYLSRGRFSKKIFEARAALIFSFLASSSTTNPRSLAATMAIDGSEMLWHETQPDF